MKLNERVRQLMARHPTIIMIDRCLGSESDATFPRRCVPTDARAATDRVLSLSGKVNARSSVF